MWKDAHKTSRVIESDTLKVGNPTEPGPAWPKIFGEEPMGVEIEKNMQRVWRALMRVSVFGSEAPQWGFSRPAQDVLPLRIAAVGWEKSRR